MKSTHTSVKNNWKYSNLVELLTMPMELLRGANRAPIKKHSLKVQQGFFFFDKFWVGLQRSYKKRSDRVKGFQIFLLLFSADDADDISVMGDVDLDNDHAVILFSSGTTGFPKVYYIFSEGLFYGK